MLGFIHVICLCLLDIIWFKIKCTISITMTKGCHSHTGIYDSGDLIIIRLLQAAVIKVITCLDYNNLPDPSGFCMY